MNCGSHPPNTESKTQVELTIPKATATSPPYSRCKSRHVRVEESREIPIIACKFDRWRMLETAAMK